MKTIFTDVKNNSSNTIKQQEQLGTEENNSPKSIYSEILQDNLEEDVYEEYYNNRFD